MDAAQAENRTNGLRVFQIILIILPTIAIILRSGLGPSHSGERFEDSGGTTGQPCWLWCAISSPKSCRNIDLLQPFSISSNALLLYYISLGLGEHLDAIPPKKRVQGHKVLYAFFFTFDTGISLAKTSALFFYARVFTTLDSRFRLALWVIHGVVLAWLIALLLSTVFLCIPVQKEWLKSLPGHCQNNEVVNLGTAIASVVIDVMILLLPMPMLWKLQARLTRKIFIFGVFICAYGYGTAQV